MAGVETVAFDVDPDRSRAFADRHGAQTAATLDDLFARCSAIDVCLPTDLHHGAALAALQAGKPTLVEKPLCPTLDECRSLMAAARASGALLVPAHVVRWFPEHRAAHDRIEAGAIGRPASVRLRRGGKAPTGTGGWFQDFARSGGVLLDLAVHDFDWLNWTLGRPLTVVSRSVRQGSQIAGAEFVGDYALTTVSYEGGCVAHVESTWLDPSGFRTTIDAAGSEGLIELDSRDNPTLRIHTDGGTRTENTYAPTDDPYYRQLQAFVEAVDSGQPPVTAEEGAWAVAVSLAALESARNDGAPTPVEAP